MRTTPDISSLSPATSARAAIMSASMRSATARKRSPSSVSSEPVVSRRNNFAPSARSSAATRRETVAWLSSSLRAAPRICPARATARNTRTSSQFIERSFAGALQQMKCCGASALFCAHRMRAGSRCIGDGEGVQCSQPFSGRDIMLDIGHFIGGKRVAGKSGRSQDLMQPMDGSVRGKLALASKDELREAVENAKAAQPAWGATNPQRRVRVLMKFLDLVHNEFDELAETLAREHGKTIADAKGDIQRGLEVVEVCIGAPHMMKGEFTDGAGPGIDVYSMRQPLGVVAGITPFNFPAMIPLWKIAPAIAAGNAFILKPSERDPSVPMRIAELFLEAGLPAGVLNVVNGDKEVVDAILDDPDIKAVGFVGSTPIAQYIYSRAAATGKRAQCFGGAKNHMIIMPDADMDQTVDALIGAGYGSAGERCMAISVAVPVGKATADALVERLIPRVEALKVGPSTDPSADFGPMITRAHRDKVLSYVDLGVEEGAKLLVDGRGFTMQGYEDGFYMGGCLFDEVRPDMRIYKEEIFGPVLSIVRADNYEDALRLPSEHEYGNGVAIFTRDGDTARDFTSRVDVGMVGVNVPIPVPIAYYTFGGWKASGFGDLNQHGPDSIRFYTKTKTVTSRWPSGIRSGAEFSIPTMK